MFLERILLSWKDETPVYNIEVKVKKSELYKNNNGQFREITKL